VRAARYAARLRFGLADAALQQVQHTLQLKPWSSADGLPGLTSRLRMELSLLLEREPWLQALRLLQAWGGLALLDQPLQDDHTWPRRLRWGQRFGLPPLAVLLAGCGDPVAVAHRLQLPQRQLNDLAAFVHLRERLLQLPRPFQDPSAWVLWLEEPGVTPTAVAFCLAAGCGPRRPLLRWLLRWRHQRSPIDAAALMASEGLAPGPQLGQRLLQLRLERIDQLEADR